MLASATRKTLHAIIPFIIFFAMFATFSATAALQQQKGGEEETGPYDVVPNWPTAWAKPGYIWGSQPGVFAESPNRIFIAVRGELKLPEPVGRGFNGIWGSLGERATVPKAEMRNTMVIVDGSGKMIDSWTQWDNLYGTGGPHKVKISPYDPERHVWVVNDSRHVIYEFTNDGKQLVMTLGETDVPGEDGKHFGAPQDVAFLPDGSLLVADGLRNSRVAKFDKTGKFVSQWGTRGNGPGQFTGLHGIDADRNGRVYVAVWVSDGTNARLLKYDASGKLIYFWGTYGTYSGAFWELHQFSVDAEGNLYTADSFGGRTQKFKPKAGADKSRLLPASAAYAPPPTR